MNAPVTESDKTLEQFYDDRFEAGYMDEWPAWKKTRIVDLLTAQTLPTRGRALDFGCGQGVFTESVRTALPGWEVFGSDLSTVAINAARQRFPECRFVSATETDAFAPFDLIFTHHVLEHVGDLDDTLALLNRRLRPGGHMVHILPCGNAGSFEHQLCSLRSDGVDPDNGRFFLDEPGHLRRLRTVDLTSRLEPPGFALIDAHYSNQYWGAVDWMTDLELDSIRTILDPSKANRRPAQARLARLRLLFTALRLLKRPPALLFRGSTRDVLAKKSWTWRDRMVLMASNPAYGVAFLMRRILRGLVDREWARRHGDPAGSEMYLVYRKSGDIALSVQ